MMKKNFLTGFAVSMACLGAAIPHPVLAAGPVASQVAQQSQIGDVQLQGGTLSGRIINSDGELLSGSVLKVSNQANQEVVSVVSSQNGEFAVSGLSTGVYQISSGNSQSTIRVWDTQAAPPSAKQDVLFVSGGPLTARGQSRLGGLSSTSLLVGGAIVAAAIAIPVAIHNSKSNNFVSGN